MNANEKYYCFIRLQKSDYYSPCDKNPKLDMYIESAYPRVMPPAAKERVMFGRHAYNIS